MNGRPEAMSPVSVDGSDWSGLNQYGKPESPFSSTFPSSRSNLATPPTSFVPGAPLTPNGPLSPSPSNLSSNPSPPNSTTARASGRASGRASDGAGQKLTKEQVKQIYHHYATLKDSIKNTSDKGRENVPKVQDKAFKLSVEQFYELITDIYDESTRRKEQTKPDHLPPRREFHPKRNDARKRLARLVAERFATLVTDVLRETQRRFPEFPNAYYRSPANMGRARTSQRGPGPPLHGRQGYPSGGPPGSPLPPRGFMGGPPPVNGNGPLPRSFQSNTMVPNKSTMVEDSDDMGPEEEDDARSDAFALDAALSRRGTTTTLGDDERRMLIESQTQVTALQEKIGKLEELLRARDDELAHSSEISRSERQEWEKVRHGLEDKVSEVEKSNTLLQRQLGDAQEDLHSQSNGSSRDVQDPGLQARYSNLEAEHQKLQAQLQQQSQVTDEVRREASVFLEEMRTLTAESQTNREHEERLSHEVHRLEADADRWRHRYAKVKAQLRHFRTSSGDIADSRPDASVFNKEHRLEHADGLVKAIHLTKFQLSVDEILRAARFEESSVVLQQIKTVIVAVRHILLDLDTSPVPIDGTAALRVKAKGQVSHTANNMIIATRNFANSDGLSPVSLLDAAASHLSTAIIELIRIVKIQPSPADEMEDKDDEADLSQDPLPDYFDTSASQRRMSNNSTYSAMSRPDDAKLPVQNGHFEGINNGWGHVPEDHRVLELKVSTECPLWQVIC